MISRMRIWHRSLSHHVGHSAGKRSQKYSCPVWADKGAYTHAFLKASGIIRT